MTVSDEGSQSRGALFAGTAGVVFGAFFSITAQEGASPAIRFAALLFLPLSGLLALGLWKRMGGGSGGDEARRAHIPFAALFIPAVFLPDYLIGAPPRTPITAALLAVPALGFLSVRHLLRAPAGGARERRIERWAPLAAAAACAFFVAASAWRALAMYAVFGYPGHDLAVFIQSFWTALHGKLFWNTQEFYPGCSRFGKQFCPIMFVIYPIFRLYPGAAVIILLDTLALGLCGFVMWLIARDRTGAFPGLCFCLCMLLYPGICYQALMPFYFMHYAPVFLLLALFYFSRERFTAFVAALALACSAREDVALTAGLFGVYALVKRRRAAWIATPLVLAAAWFGVATWAIIPRLGPGTVGSFYQDMGGSLGGIALTLARDPTLGIRKFASPALWKMLYLILMPLGVVVPLMGSEILFAAPTLLITGLSSQESTRLIYGYYYLPLIPFIFAAALSGLQRIAAGGWPPLPSLRRRMDSLCVLLLFLALAVFIRGPFAEAIEWGIRPYNVSAGRGCAETLRRAVESIPPAASVFTPRYLMPHLAMRMRVTYDMPFDAEYLIVDTRTEDPVTIRTQNCPFIRSLEVNPDYRKQFDENGVRIYRRARPR